MSKNQDQWNDIYRGGARFGIPRIVERMANLLQPGSRVLDYGCGKGQIAVYLASRGVYVVGFDISDESVRVAVEEAKRAGVAGKTRFFVSDGLDPQIDPTEEFGGVVCSYVLDYLVDGPPNPINHGGFERGLRHVQRLTSPGGLAAVSYAKIHIWPEISGVQERRETDRGYGEDKLRLAFSGWEELFWDVGQNGERQTGRWGVKNNLDVQILAKKPITT